MVTVFLKITALLRSEYGCYFVFQSCQQPTIIKTLDRFVQQQQQQQQPKSVFSKPRWTDQNVQTIAPMVIKVFPVSAATASALAHLSPHLKVLQRNYP